MGTNRTRSEVQILENYRVALDNAEQQPQIANTLAEYGYPKEEIAKGRQLFEQTRQAFDFNKQEDVETTEARADYDTHWENLSDYYGLHRKKAKVVFRNDEVTLHKLELHRAVPRSYILWVETMKTFYHGVQTDPNLQRKLARLKVAQEDIANGLASIAELENKRSYYLREKGESQEATKTKDEAFQKMDEWMRDFYAVAKIALEEQPQLLESLGLLVRS